jgi:hypothetical protein
MNLFPIPNPPEMVPTSREIQLGITSFHLELLRLILVDSSMLKFTASLGQLTRPFKCNKTRKVNNGNVRTSERDVGSYVYNMILVPTWLSGPVDAQ